MGLGIRCCTALGLWGVYWRPVSCLLPHCSLSHLSDTRGSQSFVVCLVSLLMATLCLYSTEGLILHSPPWGSAPLYGNPRVNCSSNHAWVCQFLTLCWALLSTIKIYEGSYGLCHHGSISTEHIAWHRAGMQPTLVERMSEKFLYLLS